jgi:small subunit ribosomal protein S16
VAVKIKLKRMGKIRAPFYRIIVADARTKRDGRAIEEIGKYDPKSEPSYIEVNSERAQHWLSVGAQPTDPVRRILEITGDWQKFKGLPGTEGTLKTAEAKTGKKEAFAAAVAENLKATDAKPDKGKARKPAATDTAKAKDTKAASGRTAKTDGKRAGGKSAKAADAPAQDGAASASAAEDATAPAEDSAAPAEGTAAPAEDSAAPAEGTAAPAEDSAAPAEGSAAPAEDTASAGDKQDSEA